MRISPSRESGWHSPLDFHPRCRLHYKVTRGSSVSRMPSFMNHPGVRFNDCLFTEPLPLAAWRPPTCGGIVAILARNSQWGPKPLQPLYFGEFGNDATGAASLPMMARRDDLLV